MPRPSQDEIDPYSPGRACPQCSAEGAQPHYHERPVLIVFGRTPDWPCSGKDGTLGVHMCIRCGSCGYAWTESAQPGMDPELPQAAAPQIGS
jgi:hypothetical protein